MSEASRPLAYAMLLQVQEGLGSATGVPMVGSCMAFLLGFGHKTGGL